MSDSIQTHHTPQLSEDPWIAVDMDVACDLVKGYKPGQEQKTQIMEMMASYCNILDRADVIGYGDTEQEAIEDLKTKLKARNANI